MRRLQILLFTFIALSCAPLEAQTCRGLAPLPSGELQASGSAMVAAAMHSLAAELVYALPSRGFGGVGLGTTLDEGLEKSTVDLAASLGYQLELGRAAPVQLCPVVNTTLQLGPNNAFDSGVKRSTVSAAIGFTAGTSLRLRPMLSLVPAVAIGVGHRIHQAESSTGVRLFRIAETYGLAQIHLGFVVRENISVRPTLEIPLWLGGAGPGLGLTVGYHFGKRPAAAGAPDRTAAVP